MEPEGLLDCQKCQYRESILGHLTRARRAMSEVIFDALIAYGTQSDVTLAIRDVRIVMDAMWNRIYGEGLRCEGEDVACPMGDNGYHDWDLPS